MERQDEAKAMAQMVNACKCVTIRDAQLAERKYMMLESEAENRRLDLLMEQERLKALDNYAQRDQQRKEERMQGAKVCQCLGLAADCHRYYLCTVCAESTSTVIRGSSSAGMAGWFGLDAIPWQHARLPVETWPLE